MILFNLLILLALTTKALSFQLPAHTSPRQLSTASLVVALHGTSKKDDDFGNAGGAGGDSYEGDIDWDAEWKKVVEKRDQPSDRPGKEFYKNDVERALLSTSKATAEQIKKVKIVKPDINIRSLQGDAKVWKRPEEIFRDPV